MKAILVIDIPTVDSLENLVADIEIKRQIQWAEDKEVCLITNQQLKPMPEKKPETLFEKDPFPHIVGSFDAYGWNACIKFLEGEKNEDL